MGQSFQGIKVSAVAIFELQGLEVFVLGKQV
jgi:hypothetical protein